MDLKYFKILVLTFFFIPILASTQDKVEFDILFGSYINDHYNKTFKAEERHWIFQEGKLISFVDAHNTQYSDSITLTNSDVDLITKYVIENNLNKSLTKDLSNNLIKGRDWTLVIKGDIKINDINSNFKLDADSPSILEKNRYAIKLKELEYLLYDIVEKY